MRPRRAAERTRAPLQRSAPLRSTATGVTCWRCRAWRHAVLSARDDCSVAKAMRRQVRAFLRGSVPAARRRAGDTHHLTTRTCCSRTRQRGGPRVLAAAAVPAAGEPVRARAPRSGVRSWAPSAAELAQPCVACARRRCRRRRPPRCSPHSGSSCGRTPFAARCWALVRCAATATRRAVARPAAC